MTIRGRRNEPGAETAKASANSRQMVPATQRAALPPTTDDRLADDLMREVAGAIDRWANRNRLENMPKRVVFEQALAILNSVYQILIKQYYMIYNRNRAII